MHQLPPHAEYKDSGLPWLTQIPSHWQTRRNRFLFREIDRRSVHGEETHLSMSQVHGLVPSKDLSRKSLQSENYAGGKLVEERDLVLNRLKAHLGVFARAKQEGVVSPDYTVLRPNDTVSVRYCELLFKTPVYVAEFRRRTKGIVEGFWRLYTDDFYNVFALLPPRAEQDQIVTYLRMQDAHIARYIKAKRDLIALLTEQKAVIVHQAITRGIDASVTLKKPSFEWVDEIPAHWDELPLKHISKLNNSGSYGVNPEEGQVVSPVATTAQISHDGHFLVDKMPRRGFSNSDAVRYATRPGDILVVKSSGSIFNVISGKAGIVRDNTPSFAFSNFLLRLIPDRTRVIPEYLFLLLGGHLTRERVKRMVAGTTFPNLQVGEYRSAVLPIPPIEEQERILFSISERTGPLETLIKKALQEIDLVREYRERLFSDVATGRVDVRGWQPGSDDIASDEELVELEDVEESDLEGEEGNGED